MCGRTEINMIKQKFKVTYESESCEVEYKYSRLTGKTELSVDGFSFTVKGKPLGIGVARREPIMLCGAQAMLDVDKSGRARIVLRDGEVEEV